jgi:hypothetical protein
MSFINLHKREGILDTDNRNFVSVAEAGYVGGRRFERQGRA